VIRKTATLQRQPEQHPFEA